MPHLSVSKRLTAIVALALVVVVGRRRVPGTGDRSKFTGLCPTGPQWSS
jgi:hypothetical protein